MLLRNKRLAVLLPVVFACVHLLLTAVAEIQYRTGWAYIPPNVEFDPNPLPMAEHLAVWLSFPASVVAVGVSLLIGVVTGHGLEGTKLLLLETPFVALVWMAIGYWLEVQLGGVGVPTSGLVMLGRIARWLAALCCGFLFLLLFITAFDAMKHRFNPNASWNLAGGTLWFALMFVIAIRPMRLPGGIAADKTPDH